MTADEIRNAKFEHDDGAWESARWLQEIAAQLAELNANNAKTMAWAQSEIDKTNKLVSVRRLQRKSRKPKGKS